MYSIKSIIKMNQGIGPNTRNKNKCSTQENRNAKNWLAKWKNK